ncbi:MAG TPA: DUF3574 domain-containing protein [Coleofasciculaceae cyanobacterium]|jgi:hypothetical protein
MANSNLSQQDLYFELNTSNGEDISLEDFQSFVDRVITPRFPNGLTIFDAQGQFQDITGEAIEESSQVVSLAIEDTATNETAIKEIVEEYIKFQQESVLTVVDEDIQAPNNSLCQDYTSDMFASIEVDFW